MAEASPAKILVCYEDESKKIKGGLETVSSVETYLYILILKSINLCVLFLS